MRTALITGGSRGFGRALASGLLERGWHVVLDGRDPASLATAAAELRRRHGTGHVDALSGDVTDPLHRGALARTAARLGGLDLVIHNASTLGASPLPRLEAIDLDVLRRTYEVNLVAPVALTQTLGPHLRPGATVVAVTSDAGVQPYATWGGYGGSKAALEQTFAIWGAERPDLRILVVDPGDMRTQMHQDAYPGEDIGDRPLPEDHAAPALLAVLEDPSVTGRIQLDTIVAVGR